MKNLKDAATIPQPTYVDLWEAFVAGAKEARMNPKAGEYNFNKAADAYCKLWHQRTDPESFRVFNNLKRRRDKQLKDILIKAHGKEKGVKKYKDIKRGIKEAVKIEEQEAVKYIDDRLDVCSKIKPGEFHPDGKCRYKDTKGNLHELNPWDVIEDQVDKIEKDLKKFEISR